MRYDHQKIEKKWQKYWEEGKTFKCEIDKSKPKYYVLDMFPYVSGAGLHVGHLVGYTATDIIARYKRMKGFNVLHPMGWDSFGLPTEQHAIRTGEHPAEITQINTDKFRDQLKTVGLSYDWDRELSTSDARYYKWTQWIFTKLYEKGLAYEAEIPVNYCPALGTVLANEEVEEGKSKEGGHPVERRPLRQWILKITAYAERLIDDLDLLDWPESLKRLQVNWIGKSKGAKAIFKLKDFEDTLTIFTTRPDTLFGATYMVMAPEHPLIEKITTEENRNGVTEYQKISASKSDMDRTELSKEKTGVFTGSYAINPVNGKEIPVWISDYVLMSYGTGAIMAVPAHDERDFEFAHKFNLPIVSVFDPNLDAHPDLIPDHLEPEEVRKQVMDGKICWTGEGKCIHSSNDDLSLNGMSVRDAIKAITSWLETKNLGEHAINYKLRDWLFSRQRYWGEPFPILHFEDGTKRVLDLDELPLCPPEMKDFKPSGDAQSPLAKVPEWVNITDPKTGKPAKRETNTMPQWAGSCWYYLRFADPHNDQEAWSQEADNYWQPVDMYVGGVEHAVLHLLYARFWHKVLFDCGHVHDPEPFRTLRNQGLIVARAYQDGKNHYVPVADVEKKDEKYFHKKTGEELKSQIEKMSKSKLNGVSPDDLIGEFGADSIRLYEMFMGPLDKEKIWNTDAISGCRRFLSRFFDMVHSDKVVREESEEANKLGHRLVDGVGKDLEALYFNTAIAKMMEFLNDFTKLATYPRNVIRMAIQMLTSFAPHLAEELWQHLNFDGELSYEAWPQVDEKYLHEDRVLYIVQVNGKVRGRFELEKGLEKDQLIEIAKQNETISKHLEGKEVIKEIFVPNKLLNIVIKK